MKPGLTRDLPRNPRASSFRFLLTSVLTAGALACNQSSAPASTDETRSTTSVGEGRRTSALTSGIQFVQLSYVTPQSATSSVSMKYVAAQTAGNVNVLAVGWNDTSATVSSVTDTSGNVYTRAIGPTTYPGALTPRSTTRPTSWSAAAGANSVKIVFSQAAAYVDVRVLEYAGST